jgi:hypothetical protein
MRKYALSVSMLLLVSGIFAQNSMQQIMEKRARAFHKVLSLTDTESYKKFMRENYTKAYLEKPIKLNRVVNDSDGGSTGDKEKPLDNLDAKAAIYEQLHNDFGGASISSLTKKDNAIILVVKSVGLKGTFTLMFNKEKPYLIDGMGIEADMEN